MFIQLPWVVGEARFSSAEMIQPLTSNSSIRHLQGNYLIKSWVHLMDIKKTFAAVVVALTLIAVAYPLLFSQEDDSLPRRIVKWSEAEQTAWLNSYLSDGMPQPFWGRAREASIE